MNNHVPNVLVFNRYFIFCFFTCPPVHTFSASLQTFCQTATWRPRGRFSCHFSCFVSSVQQEVQYLCSGFLFIIYSARITSKHNRMQQCVFSRRQSIELICQLHNFELQSSHKV